MDNEFSLKDKVVVVTGAYGLIGQEVCDALACFDASVVVVDIADEEKLIDFSNMLNKKHQINSISFHLDIVSSEMVNKVINSIIKEYGKIDVLINLAAIDAKFDDNINAVPKTSFENFPLDKWEKSINTNITGTFIMTQAVILRMLKKKSGNIINVASTYSLVAPNQDLYNVNGEDQQIFKPVDYVVSKSVIPNFSRYLATFYGKKGIRANTIIPHGIFNDHPQGFINNFKKYTPLARMCDVREIRGSFIFLASNASSYMTGSTLVVDGGWTAW